MTTRADIVRVAREWLGTRWQHQASVKGVATDCIGLIGGVALELGLPGAEQWKLDPDLHCYGREPDPRMLLAAVKGYLDRIEIDDAATGDVLLCRFNKEPQHFAIMSGSDPGTMIHAYAQARRVVENRIDDVWRSRIIGAYSFRGIDG
jgi:NlpC/P60 family putative phage cell wall peptidase